MDTGKIILQRIASYTGGQVEESNDCEENKTEGKKPITRRTVIDLKRKNDVVVPSNTLSGHTEEGASPESDTTQETTPNQWLLELQDQRDAAVATSKALQKMVREQCITLQRRTRNAEELQKKAEEYLEEVEVEVDRLNKARINKKGTYIFVASILAGSSLGWMFTVVCYVLSILKSNFIIFSFVGPFSSIFFASLLYGCFTYKKPNQMFFTPQTFYEKVENKENREGRSYMGKAKGTILDAILGSVFITSCLDFIYLCISGLCSK